MKIEEFKLERWLLEKNQIDVGGGYDIDIDETGVAGGDAGSLMITSEKIEVDGEITGHSMIGCQGGELFLWTKNLEIGDEPDFSDDTLVVTSEWLGHTGMTQITLKSLNDILLNDIGTLTTSHEKYQIIKDMDVLLVQQWVLLKL